MNYEYIVRYVDMEGGRHKTFESEVYDWRESAELKADELRADPLNKSVRIERRTVGRWEPLEVAMKEIV